MKLNPVYVLIFILSLTGCKADKQPAAGHWRALLLPDTARPNLEIPFDLEILISDNKSVTAIIRNASEEITVSEIIVLNDSIHFNLPVFEGTIDAALRQEHMEGTYTHRGSGRSWTVPFHADFGITDRFPEFTDEAAANISGRWEVTVGTGAQSEKQIAEFIQDGSHLTGTFLTTTGDYRFLEGKVSGTRMMVSAFDGAHALIFQADLSPGGSLDNGIFCGGPAWKGDWRAVRNDTVTLPDPTTLTWLKPGYEKLEFTFPDLEGNPVSLTDPRFSGKPVIVQIIGSWCPNCLDETRYFTGLYQEFKDKGLEIIALCYESADQNQSIAAIKRFRSNIGAGYIFLYAGESNKRKAGETLPMLNRILSFPTSLFIDREGKVQKIFTGFSGPGTGVHYTKLTGEMRSITEEIVKPSGTI